MSKEELMKAKPIFATERIPNEWAKRSRIYYRGAKPDLELKESRKINEDIWELELPEGFVNIYQS
jgi:hypothetical protein